MHALTFIEGEAGSEDDGKDDVGGNEDEVGCEVGGEEVEVDGDKDERT